MIRLHDALTALFVGLPAGADRTLLDSQDVAASIRSDADLSAFLEREAEPYVVALAGDRVAFLHEHVENASPGEWRSLHTVPTLVLTKGGSEVRYFALSDAPPRHAIEMISAAIGCDLDLPVPLPGANGWEVAHLETIAYGVTDLAEAFCDDRSAPVPVPVPAAAKHLDATIRTPFDFDDPALGEVVTITGAGSAKATTWKPRQMTRGAVIDEFCKHREAAAKDGPAVVLGELPLGPRTAQAVASLSFVGLDLDTGFSVDELARRVEASGLMAVIYTTHSHLKTTTREPHDALIRWLEREGLGDDITIDAVKARLRFKGYDAAIVASATFEQGRGDAGREVIISHDPMPKMRVIVPLLKPFVIAENGKTDAAARETWRLIPEGLAAMLGDLPIDKTGSDPNRLFYLPAHAPGAPWRIDLFGGRMLDWRPLLQQQMPAAAKSARKQAKGPFTPKWAARRADGLQIADLIMDHAADRVRGRNGVKLIVECPFDADHSNPGDPTDAACMVINAGEGAGAGFAIRCQHESCKPHDRLAMLNRMVSERWFDVEAVTGDQYDALLRDQPSSAIDSAPDDYVLPPHLGTFTIIPHGPRPYLVRKSQTEPLCTRFAVIGGARYPDRDNARDVELAIENEAGEREVVRLDAEKLPSKQTAIGLLRGRGMGFASPDGEAFAHRVLMTEQPTNRVLRDKTGWLEDGSFLMPTGVLVGGDAESVGLSDEVRIKAPPTKGTLDGWRAGAAAACASDSRSLHAALMSGFAGPLLALTGQGTLVLCLTGTSSRGKSWRQMCGVAVSGPPGPGVGQMMSMNSTAVALEIPLERGSGTTTAFDELHHAPARMVQNLIYSASGQQGRNRARTTGHQGLVRSWRGGVVTLSTEVNLAQRLRQEGERLAGGATVRMLEVDAEAGHLPPETFHAADGMIRNYGHALPPFLVEVRRLGYVDRPDLLAKRVVRIAEALNVGDDPMALRAATGLGYLGVAGEIAMAAGLLPPDFDVTKMVEELWAGAMGGEMRAEDPVTRAIAELLETINARWGTDVYDPAAQDEKLHPRDPSREIGCLVSDLDGEKVYVLRASLLGKWSGGYADERALKSALLKHDIAIPYQRGKSAGAVWDRWRRPIGRTAVIVLRASAVEGEAPTE